jgi:hypothetical protein
MNAIGAPELIGLVAIVLSLLLVVWPASRICQRLGFSPWLAILAIVPIGNLLLLWFVSYAPWPADTAAGRR